MARKPVVDKGKNTISLKKDILDAAEIPQDKTSKPKGAAVNSAKAIQGKAEKPVRAKGSAKLLVKASQDKTAKAKGSAAKSAKTTPKKTDKPIRAKGPENLPIKALKEKAVKAPPKTVKAKPTVTEINTPTTEKVQLDKLDGKKADVQIKGFASRDNHALKKVAESFGQRLRKIRIDNRLTVKEIAGSLHLNAMTFSRYESGTRIPDADICAQICILYGVDASWLLFGDLIEGNFSIKNMSEERIAANYKTIPVYELADAHHANQLISGAPIEEISVPKSLVHENTVAIIYHEANMAPYITPGAVVGIGSKPSQTPMGHVYAIWIPNTGTRLFRAFSSTFTEVSLRSDNATTPDILISLSEFQSAVLGRIEWLFQAC